MLQWQLNRFPSTEALVSETALRWLTHLDTVRRFRAITTVALAGGRVAGRLMEATAQAATDKGFSWEGIHFFWGDERCVPPTDPESNFLLASKAILEPCRIPAEQIHRIRGELAPLDAAESMGGVLGEFTEGDRRGFPMLDLVLLGMGEDGHVASLFPDTPDSLARANSVFVPVIGPKPPPQRVSLTYGALTAAREVWVIASGLGKEDALEAALTTEHGNPLARLLRMRPHTKIFTDIDTQKLPFSPTHPIAQRF